MRKAILEMVWKSDEAETLRRRVVFLETHVGELEKAIMRASDEKIALARRVKELEETVARLKLELSED